VENFGTFPFHASISVEYINPYNWIYKNWRRRSRQRFFSLCILYFLLKSYKKVGKKKRKNANIVMGQINSFN